MKVFKNLKVVELASVLAGPAVGMFFAELGAEVIKIENSTTGGDVTRSWKLPNEQTPLNTEGYADSAYFHSVNYHKKHLFYDLQNETDKAKTYEILRGCDVVIANFRKSSAIKMGMDYESLKKINPSIIYAQLYGFDEEDETPAFDVVLQAEAGFMYMNGEKGGQPVKMPVALIDILAAHQLKEAILIALLEKAQTGKGAFISTSLYESAVASLANQATNWLIANHVPQRMGSEHPNIAPYGDIFLTADDKEIVLACGTQRQWLGLCQALEISYLSEDDRFKTNQERVVHRQELFQLLKQEVKKHTREYLLALLKKYSVPVGAIRTMPEVFQNPVAQNMILEEGLNSKKVKTVAFKITH